MKNKIFLPLVFIAALSCHSTPPNEKTVNDRNNDTASIPDKAQTIIDPPQIQNKYDSLILAYIKSTDKELIRSAVKTNEKIEWLFDRTEQTDSATYYIFNIGQDVTDENVLFPMHVAIQK